MKTKSEQIFEDFLLSHSVPFEKIAEDVAPRPDYLVSIGDSKIIFEVKELTEDENFGVVSDPLHPQIKGFSGTIGKHVRRMIGGAKRQIQYGAKQGIPSVLLIYNALDRVFQTFGTADMDFIAAMYGEYTILIDKNTRKASEMFNGKNQSLQQSKNTSFSAVGRLCDHGGKTTVTLFENAFALVEVPYDQLPPCFDVHRVEVSVEPSPPSPAVEAPASVNVDPLPLWHVIRDAVSDMAAALGVTVGVGVVIVLPSIWRSRGHAQPDSPPFLLGINYLTELSLLYFGFRRLKVNRERGLSLRLLEGSPWFGALGGVAVGIASLAFNLIYQTSLWKLFHVSAHTNTVLESTRGNLLLSLGAVIVVSLVAPACEEFFFRGIIFGSAREINRARLGAVIASLLFALAHVNLVLSPYYIFVSLAACWWFTRCRTILGPIAAHMTINTVVCLLFLVRP